VKEGAHVQMISLQSNNHMRHVQWKTRCEQDDSQTN
jgi:hypothetical protein